MNKTRQNQLDSHLCCSNGELWIVRLLERIEDLFLLSIEHNFDAVVIIDIAMSNTRLEHIVYFRSSQFRKHVYDYCCCPCSASSRNALYPIPTSLANPTSILPIRVVRLSYFIECLEQCDRRMRETINTTMYYIRSASTFV